MHRQWKVGADVVEHLGWPRCRFEFRRDGLGNWWRGKTQWLEDPLERLDHLGGTGFTELVLRLTHEAELVFERGRARVQKSIDREPEAEAAGV